MVIDEGGGRGYVSFFLPLPLLFLLHGALYNDGVVLTITIVGRLHGQGR